MRHVWPDAAVPIKLNPSCINFGREGGKNEIDYGIVYLRKENNYWSGCFDHNAFYLQYKSLCTDDSVVLYKGLVMKGNIGDLNDVVWITSTYKHGPKMVKKSPSQTVTVRIEEVKKRVVFHQRVSVIYRQLIYW